MNEQIPPPTPNTARSSKTRVLPIVVSVLIGIWLVPTIFLAVLDWAHERARHATCTSNVRQIGLACGMYADQHDGNLPHNLDDLKPYVASTKVFFCPQTVGVRQRTSDLLGLSNENIYSYEFIGVTNKWLEAPDVAILREIEPRHNGWRTVLFDDGHAAQQPGKP